MGRQPLPTNTILGNGSDQYRIDTVLGPGGFGITYLAHDLRFGRDVAIKEYFPAEFAYRDGSTTIRSSTRGAQQNFFEQGKRHFLDEARTLAKFRHEHIVRVLNLFEQYNTAYMVLEFEDGQSLKAWLKALGRRPTQAELDQLVQPMLSALELVHAKGMFHRDIAPDNIIVRPDGAPVLIDFGAARHFVREHSHTLGAIVKVGYSPPEQYLHDTKLQGAWTDIYALSATIFAAITGHPPDEATKRSLGDEVLPVERHLGAGERHDYDPTFLQALNLGLALKPKDRPQSIAEVRQLLYPPDHPSPAIPGARAGAGRRAEGPGQRVDGGGRQSETVHASRPVLSLVDPASPHPEAVSADRAVRPSAEPYPEGAASLVGGIALAVAALAATAFLQIGGIEHPAGLASAMIVCGGLVVAGFERAITVARTSAPASSIASAAGMMSALALAIYWLPLFIWPLSVALGLVALGIWQARPGGWVPIALGTIGVVHLGLAAVLLVVAARATQKDPVFLPMMGVTLALLATLVMVAAMGLRRHLGAQAA